MKRISFILAAAIVFAVGSAFTTASIENSKPVVDLYWFDTNTAGTVITSASIPDVAEPQASNRTGCPLSSGNTFCGRGYTEAQTELNATGDRVIKSSTVISSGLPVKRTN